MFIGVEHDSVTLWFASQPPSEIQTHAETVEVFLAAASSHQQCLPPAQGPIERADPIRQYPSIRVALGDLKHCVSKCEFRCQVDANTTWLDRRGRRVVHSPEH